MTDLKKGDLVRVAGMMSDTGDLITEGSLPGSFVYARVAEPSGDCVLLRVLCPFQWSLFVFTRAAYVERVTHKFGEN